MTCTPWISFAKIKEIPYTWTEPGGAEAYPYVGTNAHPSAGHGMAVLFPHPSPTARRGREIHHDHDRAGPSMAHPDPVAKPRSSCVVTWPHNILVKLLSTIKIYADGSRKFGNTHVFDITSFNWHHILELLAPPLPRPALPLVIVVGLLRPDGPWCHRAGEERVALPLLAPQCWIYLHSSSNRRSCLSGCNSFVYGCPVTTLWTCVFLCNEKLQDRNHLRPLIQ